MKLGDAPRRGPARTAALLVALASVPACSAVLGLDESYTDVVKALCECTKQLPAECDSTLRNKLAAADPKEVEDWLTRAKALDCGQNCGTSALCCYYEAPGTCRPKGEGCTVDEECCGYCSNKPDLVCGDSDMHCIPCNSCKSALGTKSLAGPDLCPAAKAQLTKLSACASEKVGAASKCPPCFAPLSNWTLCSTCLEKECKTELDACNADGS